MADTDLITLADARTALQLREAQVQYDEDIETTYIPAVTPVVEDVIGPVVKRPRTFTANGGARAVLLPYGIDSVTSVVVDGQALAAGKYSASLSSGIVYAGGSTSPTVFTGGRGAVVVTYVAGVCADTASVPAHIKLAARIILQSMFGSMVGYQGESDDQPRMVQTPSGYWIPIAAHALLLAGDGDDLVMPGFA